MNPRKILIAVDASDNAARAVRYVVDVLNGAPGYEVTVLYIERPPSRDLFPDEAGWLAACTEQETRIRDFVRTAREDLVASGLSADTVSDVYVPSCQSPAAATQQECSLGTSIARDILRHQQQGGYGTLVIGRRGVSRAEEFLFGSVTTKVTHLAKDCTVWVVQ